MSESVMGSSAAPQQTGRLIGRLVVAALVLLLGYEAIHFWLRDPLHYIIDPTEKSFGAFWPRSVGSARA